MITEMQAATLMTEANPVPDLDSYNVADLGVAAYLSDLEQRSSGMTQPDTKQKDQEQKKTVRQRWLVAAVVGILAGVALLLVNQSGETPAADQETLGPAETLEAYIVAYNGGDIEEVMTFFTEESTITGHPYGINNPSLIRSMQRRDLVSAADENAYTISNVEVSGNTVTWDHLWVSSAGQEYCQFGQKAVIEDGIILSWTWPDGDFDCP